MTNRTLADFIRERRETLGLLPVDLANRSGLTKSEISAIEKGKIAFPGADKRRRLAEALGVRHIDLVIAAGELLEEEVPEPGAPTVVDKLRWHLRRQIERRLRAEDWHSQDLVFDRGNGQIFNEHSLRNRHFEVCALSDVPVIRLHDLRHTSASLELESGTLSKIVAERLGHQSTGMTDRYGHVSTELQVGASHALAERLRVTENTLNTDDIESA